ncbi:MAG: hypothetical protein ACK5Q5_00935 [Planctomycetaceae bacterium]
MSYVGPTLAGVIHRSVRTEEFSISFSEPFRIVFFGTLITLEAMCLSVGAAGEWWLLAGVIPAMTSVFSALSVAILVWRYRFSVGPEGISCYDFWCQPLTTKWDEMREISRIWLPGLAYLRINTDDRYRALWLPLFVAQEDELRELVALHAGPRHPLTLRLDRELPAEPR